MPIGSSSWTKAGWHGAVTLALVKKQAELKAGVSEVELEGCHVLGGAAGSRGRPRCSKVFPIMDVSHPATHANINGRLGAHLQVHVPSRPEVS